MTNLPTIALSPSGYDFLLTLTGGDNTTKSHTLRFPVNETGMRAMRMMLQERQLAESVAEVPHGIGLECNPTQDMVDDWLLSHHVTTSKPVPKRTGPPINIDLKELGLI